MILPKQRQSLKKPLKKALNQKKGNKMKKTGNSTEIKNKKLKVKEKDRKRNHEKKMKKNKEVMMMMRNLKRRKEAAQMSILVLKMMNTWTK